MPNGSATARGSRQRWVVWFSSVFIYCCFSLAIRSHAQVSMSCQDAFPAGSTQASSAQDELANILSPQMMAHTELDLARLKSDIMIHIEEGHEDLAWLLNDNYHELLRRIELMKLQLNLARIAQLTPAASEQKASEDKRKAEQRALAQANVAFLKPWVVERTFEETNEGRGSFAFSPDSTLIAIAMMNHTVQVWNLQTGAMVAETRSESDHISSVSFDATGTRLLTTSLSGRAVVWDAKTGDLIRERHFGHVRLRFGAFHPNGTQVALAGSDHVGRLWTTATDEIFELLGHVSDVDFTAFSADGERLLTTSWDWQTRIWSRRLGWRVQSPIRHHGVVHAAAFSPDGTLVATASANDRVVPLWSTRSRKRVGRLKGHTDEVKFIGFNRGGKKIVTTSFDRTGRVWETDTAKELFVLQGHTGPVHTAAFQPGDRFIATGSLDGTVKIWDEQGKVVETIEATPDSNSQISILEFSPDGNRLAVSIVNATGSAPILKIWTRPPG